MNEYIIKSNMFIWLKDEFSKMKGIKLYSIFKIVEYILSLFNKFGYDMDIQLLRIINAKKIKHKFFSSLIIIIFIFLNIYIFNIFYFCTWLILNDIEKNFLLIYLKVNFIEFKQANKAFKSIHNFLANDIFDRFLNFFIMTFILLKGFIENKIQIDFNNIYFKRICFYCIAEFISDYLKGIITFKINNLNPKCIKLFLIEEIYFYKELDNSKSDINSYFYLKDTNIYNSYTSFIHKESLICILLNINIYPFIIIFIREIFLKDKIFSLFTIPKIFLLIIIKYVLEALIERFDNKFLHNIKSDNRDINSKLSKNISNKENKRKND